MEYSYKLYDDLVNYSKKRNWDIGKRDSDIRGQSTYSNLGGPDSFEINVYRSPQWEFLLGVYDEDTLVNHFMKMLRVRFKKYKGLSVRFKFNSTGNSYSKLCKI